MQGGKCFREEHKEWLSDARVLVDGRVADPERAIKARPGLEEHKAKLAELRSRAHLERDEARLEIAQGHASYGMLEAYRAERTWFRRMLELEAWPEIDEAEAAFAQEGLPGQAAELMVRARRLVGPEPEQYGEEVAGYVLASRALDGAVEAEYAQALMTLAWAQARTGRLDEALASAASAVEEAGGDSLKEERARLAAEVARWQGDALDERLDDLALHDQEIESLEIEVGQRVFADPEERWWERQLTALVSGIEALHDPETGLAGETEAEPFGWGIAKRLTFAETIAERSIDGGDVRERWAEANAAIRTAEEYGGLVVTPLMGFVPVGTDPESGLWEFADLQTGEPPVRGEDGRLVLTEQTGLVFVLVPAGSFWMGAQKTDPVVAVHGVESELLQAARQPGPEPAAP